MSAGNRLALRALGDGPYELVLRCEGAGEQRFSEFTLEMLARAIGRPAPFTTHRRTGDPAVYVDAPWLDFVRHSPALEVLHVPERVAGFHVDKAERNRAERAAHERALARASELLRAYKPLPVRRPATVAWLRETPAEQWPPLRITLAQDGTPILTDGHHRLAVARELGMGEVPAQVRTAMGVVDLSVGV